MPFWAQVREIARKDLVIEIRTAEVLLMTVPFAAAALVLIPFAIGTDAPLLAELGPGLFWIVVLLFGVLVILRKSAVDEGPQQDLVRLLGIDPAARFTGSTVATSLLVLLFEVALLPILIALYNPDLGGWWWMAAVLPLVAAGLGLLGSLTGGVTASLGTRTSLTPLLIVPLALPLLVGATQAVESLQLGRSILPWLVLLAAVDLALAVSGVLAARPLEEVTT
ncbi:MAG: ABC transporter permease [Acidimicrobiia bacterium]|nr:heme exporter protein CcmB [Acidimicrobiia bacterium]MBT8217289.1 heme exporter protein CcmB [Acidimicrobiia bacterium]NNF08877.1 ABC transporter permease [Acidimicrobiia bacterium]NNL70940.1 ABC transporter permease [Acidimicrobiia bacterium]